MYFVDASRTRLVTSVSAHAAAGSIHATVGAMTQEALVGLLRTTASKWSAYNAPRLGAALAYYTLLSIAPLLILIVAICGLVFNRTTAEQDLLRQVRDLAGYSGAETVRMLIGDARRGRTGVLATCIGIVTLLFGASGVFMELRNSLNTIWGATPRESSMWRDMIWQRLVSFGMVLALGFLLLVSLILSAGLTIAEKFFTGVVPLHAALMGDVVNFIVSLIAIAALFALIFKYIPEVRIRWRDVGIGAVTTAILFSIGKTLLALYLGTVGVGSTYGAAGSLVALVVWVYYSAQIFFFGAIFTRVYADTFGSHAHRGRWDLPRGQAETSY